MLVSVIVITRNRPEMVDKCLEHLLMQSYEDIEIILVDSSTTLKTEQLVQAKFPRIHYLYLKNGKNKMQVSRNVGIQHAKGDIICFLDDDSMAQENWIENIVRSFSDQTVGAVGGIVLEPHGPQEEPAGNSLIGRVLENGERVTNYHLNPGKILEVDLVRGCNMAFRRDTIRRIGGFDPAFTGTNVFEAGDYCMRVRNTGLKVLFNPEVKVIHLSAPREDIPRELTDPRTQFYNSRNWVLWVGKNIGWNSKNLRHIWFNQTFHVMHENSRIKGKRWVIPAVNIAGKICGMYAWFIWKYMGNKEPCVL